MAGHIFSNKLGKYHIKITLSLLFLCTVKKMFSLNLLNRSKIPVLGGRMFLKSEQKKRAAFNQFVLIRGKQFLFQFRSLKDFKIRYYSVTFLLFSQEKLEYKMQWCLLVLREWRSTSN